MKTRDLPTLDRSGLRRPALRGLAVACAFVPLTASAQLLDTADDLPPPVPDEAPVPPIVTAVEPVREGAIRRFALVIGANDGGRARVRLKYAESDALAVAKVFQRLGGVSDPDRLLLMNPDRAALNNALERMRTRLDLSRDTARRTELFVYYSGHSDEAGLLLSEDRYGYGEFRDALMALSADVRVTILDSCASGAMTRLKGGTFKPPFLVDDSSKVKGHAILTSASADEAAQESDRLGASFFTHYLLSGLRGAADATNDGRVTLNEAYQFAFNETLARTAQTSAGAQHPEYDINLSGSGDLVMTDLRITSGGLVLGPDIDGRLFVRDGLGRLAAELRKNAGRAVELGLEPGDYVVTLVKDEEPYGLRAVIGDGKRTTITKAQFAKLPREYAQARGDVEPRVGAGPSAPASAAPLATGAGEPPPGVQRIVIDLPRIEIHEVGQALDGAWNVVNGRSPVPSISISPAPPAPPTPPTPPTPPLPPVPPAPPLPPAAPMSPTPASTLPQVDSDGRLTQGTPQPLAPPPPPAAPAIVGGYTHVPITFRLFLDTGVVDGKVLTNLSLSPSIGRVAKVEGMQLSLFGGFVDDDLSGVQLSTLVNGVGRDATGVQLGSFVNYIGRDGSGFVASGLGNVVGRDWGGTQLAGFFNVVGRNQRGLQVAGLFNVGLGGTEKEAVLDSLRDVAGLNAPTAEEARWSAQAAGFFNWSGGWVKGTQVAGLFNVAGLGLTGAQVSVINVGGDIDGAQVGVINIARKVKGTQVGIVNVNEDIDGVPVGLLTFSALGQRSVELWLGDATLLNVGYRLGSKHFHTLFLGGYDPRSGGRFSAGLGFGAHFPLGAFTVGGDLSASQQFVGRSRSSIDLLGQARAIFGWQASEWFVPYVGAGLNLSISESDTFQSIAWADGDDDGRVGDVFIRQWPAIFIGVKAF